MKVAYDLDGTILADPEFYRAEMEGLRKRGHEVVILTGTHTHEVTPQEISQKLGAISAAGLVEGRDYDHAVAVAGPEKNVPKNKVKYMKSVGVSHLVDNRKENCKAARKAGITAHHHMSPK